MNTVRDNDVPTPGEGGRLSFATHDPDEARDRVGRTFAEHDLELTASKQLDFHLDLVPSSRLTIGRMSYGTDATLAGPPMRTCYHVNLTLAGTQTVAQNGRRRTTDAGKGGVAFLPDGPLQVTWSREALQYAIKLPRRLLESHVAKLAGRLPGEPIGFDLTFSLESGAGRSLVATAGFLYTELGRPGGLATMPAACHELEESLMTQLLLVVPSQLSDVLHGPPASCRRSRIQEVVELIDANPAASLADLAAAVGISVRTMQAGFHDLLGISPSAYLRGSRLDRVHRELAGGTGRSVSEVATAWGFFHPGHFAQQYRDRFGVLPSQTAGVSGH